MVNILEYSRVRPFAVIGFALIGAGLDVSAMGSHPIGQPRARAGWRSARLPATGRSSVGPAPLERTGIAARSSRTLITTFRDPRLCPDMLRKATARKLRDLSNSVEIGTRAVAIEVQPSEQLSPSGLAGGSDPAPWTPRSPPGSSAPVLPRSPDRDGDPAATDIL